MQENLQKSDYTEVFIKAYQALNPEQKEAVDTIDGPVMVIAGPGTGKTQILALRVANILQQTDSQAHNILCLTFTEAGVQSMRRRLVQMIGPIAHQVNIYTFHAFCNNIIQENLGRFNQFKELEVLSDLEAVELYRTLEDELPNDHPLKRLRNDDDVNTRRFSNLFKLMKEEYLSQEAFIQLIDEHILRMYHDQKYRYQRKTKTTEKTFEIGDLKEKMWEEFSQKMAKTKAAVALFDRYSELLTQMNRFEYTDMILWVLREFTRDHEFLLSYQEKYHFILVDEFQDTNGAQNALIKLLASYWGDQANVFVVGDADQAIYKFQGANVENITAFEQKYSPRLITLKHNYRSTQNILNISHKLIKNNNQRLNPDVLIAHSNHASNDEKINILIFPNNIQEETYYADLLTTIYRQTNILNNIAIIYRRHSQVENLVNVLEKRSIPLNISKRVDILKLVFVRNLCNILKYIEQQSKEPGKSNELLFEIMHYNFFGLDARDINKISLGYLHEDFADRSYEYRIDTAITKRPFLEKLELGNIDSIIHFSNLLSSWIASIRNSTFQELFENVINNSGLLNQVINGKDKTWELQLLTTLFDLIKSACDKNYLFSISDFNRMIEDMNTHHIPLPVSKVVSDSTGVHFLTAHASKGLEFDQVYVIGATHDMWKPRRSGSGTFSYPDQVKSNDNSTLEDERRLMYVAMTRARQQLTLSYPLKTTDGKDLSPTVFIDEIAESSHAHLETITISESAINQYQYHTLLSLSKQPTFIEHAVIDRVLANFKLSVTALNKYLKCPISFYFENILRIPSARSKHIGFGRAIHGAIEKLFNRQQAGNAMNLADLLKYFDKTIEDHRSYFTEKEWIDMKAYGQKCLSSYFENRLSTLPPAKKIISEYRIDIIDYKGVPIKGLLDRVDFYDHHIHIIDYKTGSPKNFSSKLKMPDDKNELGGDYWRQMVFYHILMTKDNRNTLKIGKGLFEVIEPDSQDKFVVARELMISQDEIDIVGEQIVTVWRDINDHKFDKRCDEETCRWCNFIKNDYVLSLPDEDEEVEMTTFMMPDQ